MNALVRSASHLARLKNRSPLLARACEIQKLEGRQLLAANPLLTEFMAKNGVTITDGFGDNSDWIEIANTGDQSIDLAGWHLSDSNNYAKWTFPSFVLEPGQIRLVFASSRNTTDPAGNVHTNFSLSQDGEKLTFSKPDQTVVSQYGAGTNFPAQLADVSYGPGTIYDRTTLVGVNASKRAFVATNGTLDAGQWTAIGFDDSGWVSGTKGVGYDTGAYEPNVLPPAIVGQWKASSFTGMPNNTSISAWTDLVGGATAYSTGSPRYIVNAMNGQPAIRFTPSDGDDRLRVAAASNPLAGEGDFTVVVVFNAVSGIGSSGQWYNNAGLVDAEVGGTTNDWGMSFSSSGRVGAGIGGPDTSVYSGTGFTGAPHVAVFTRSGGNFTLYVDGGNGVSATGSATSRGLTDVVFGAIQTNINHFNGDIAEIRMYDGPMNSTVAYTVTNALATTYGVANVTAPTNQLGATLTGNWTADSLNGLSNNAAVTNWSSTVGSRTATASGQPRLQKNIINGHSVVRFNPNDGTNDSFRLSAASNPLAGLTDFSVAVVFRTSAGGLGSSTQWYSNAGLVDAEIGGVANDWGLAFTGAGEVGVGMGNPDVSVYSNTGYNNGVAHVAILSRTGATFSLSIDGSEAYVGSGSDAARNVSALTFGCIQTDINYFTGDIAEIQLYAGGLDTDAAHALAGQLGDKYGVSIDADRYDPLLGVDLESTMAGLATTALVRVPFNVSNPSQYNKLFLETQYDDGFIAYLNGVEIARRNFVGTATYNSVASAQQLDSDAMNFESIDISQHLGLLSGSGQNVLSFRIFTTGVNDPDLLLVPQLVAAKTSFGSSYMKPATPGAANGEGFAGFVSDLSFTKTRGIYTAAFDVTVSTNVPGTTLVYTLDGSEPTLTNGILLTPASPSALNSFTLHVAGSTTLRAAGFKNTFLPSTIGTQTYIFPASVLNQGNTAPTGAYWDTEVDPQIVNANQTFTVSQALSALPSVSVVMNFEDMFGSTGIYRNPTQRGRQWERETSIEYFDPNGSTGNFQIDAGIRVQGGASRDPSKPKRSFRLYFRSEYGVGELEAPGLFGSGNQVTSWDHLVLRAGHNYTWANDGNGMADYLRDEFARGLQETINGYTLRGSFVHLYLNGQYWGVYNLVEDIDENWASQHFGGDEDTYDLLEPDNFGGMELKAGTVDAWNNLFSTVDAAYDSAGIDNTEYAAISNLVDMESLVGYIINAYWRGDRDAPSLIGNDFDPRNYYAFRRNDIAGKFMFQTWDGELAMDDVNFDRTELQGNQNPARLFYRLRTNSEFQQFVTDKIQKLFFNGGPLEVSATVNKPRDLYNSLVSEINVGIVGESARWGDAKRDVPFTRDIDWINSINWIRNTYLAQRSAVSLNQFKNDFPAANKRPPAIYINGSPSRGGAIGTNSTLTLLGTAPAAGDQLYYTLDGSDPRAVGGGLAPGAILYTGGVTLNVSATLTVRTLNGTTWSGKDSVAFVISGTAPTLSSSAFLLTGAAPQVSFTFNRSLVASGQTPVLNITKAGGGTVTSTGYTISGNSITFNLPTGLASGNYTATLVTSGVTDTTGNAPAVPLSLNFSFLMGDVNSDHVVDFSDLLILAQNYGQIGRSYAQGNLNFSGDGSVAFDDLLILAQNYGQSMVVQTKETAAVKKTRTVGASVLT
jgi:hypothetical protein